MKLFLGFMLICFIAGMTQRKMRLQLVMWLLTGLCVCICIGYFFFRQI